MRVRVPMAVVGLLLALSASAQTIYQCPRPDGSVAYTDVKCSGPRAKVVQLAAQPDIAGSGAAELLSSTQLSGLSLAGLYQRTRALGARARELDAARDRDVAMTKMRLRANEGDRATEVARIKATWPPQIQAVAAAQRQVTDEIRRRCPGGAAFNSTRQICRK